MGKLLPAVVIGGLALFAYQRYQRQVPVQVDDQGSDRQVERDVPHSAVADSAEFHCDGRKHCSEMSSCKEATWFLEHCPGTKMDGDRDGIPCEDQHCGH